MRCKDCVRYESASKKCLDAKVNPQTWDMAVNVANVMGVRAICTFNDHRERLVQIRQNRINPLQEKETANQAPSLNVVEDGRRALGKERIR